MMADPDHQEQVWFRFLRTYCEYPETTRGTPAFLVMLSELGRLLLVRLGSTALLGPSKEVRMHAAIVLQEVIEETDFLETIYSGLPLDTMHSVRRCALHLMVNNEVGSDVQECGLLLTVKLFCLSSQYDAFAEWPELIELVDRAFTEDLDILDLIIDVVCELPDEYTPQFVRYLAPSFLRYLNPFITTLRYMFAQGVDQRVFILLPYLYTHLTQRSWKTLLGAAFMSPFFHNESRPYARVLAAIYLGMSVRITTCSFSYDWIPPMNGNIFAVLFSGDPNRPRHLMEPILGSRLRRSLSTKRFE